MSMRFLYFLGVVGVTMARELLFKPEASIVTYGGEIEIVSEPQVDVIKSAQPYEYVADSSVPVSWASIFAFSVNTISPRFEDVLFL